MAYYKGKIFSTTMKKAVLGDTLELPANFGFFVDFGSGNLTTISSKPGISSPINLKIDYTIRYLKELESPTHGHFKYQGYYIVYYRPRNASLRLLFIWDFQFFGIIALIPYGGSSRDTPVNLGENYGEQEYTSKLIEASVIPQKFMKLVKEL